MNTWYIFSSMGFYPVNLVSGEYIVGSYLPSRPQPLSTWIFFLDKRPFFDKATISLSPQPHLSRAEKEKKQILRIIAKDVPSKPYSKSLTINRRKIDLPIVRHEDIANGGEIVFEMSAKLEDWGNGLLVSLLYYSSVFLHLVCSNDVPSKRADNRWWITNEWTGRTSRISHACWIVKTYLHNSKHMWQITVQSLLLYQSCSRGPGRDLTPEFGMCWKSSDSLLTHT